MDECLVLKRGRTGAGCSGQRELDETLRQGMEDFVAWSRAGEEASRNDSFERASASERSKEALVVGLSGFVVGSVGLVRNA